MQHRPQAHNAQVLAPNSYLGMGGCCNIDGCNAESARVLCCAVLVGDPKNDERDIQDELTGSSLGVAESGLFPGVVYYLSMWYKRNERQYRISLFFSCASLAGAFGGVRSPVPTIYCYTDI